MPFENSQPSGLQIQCETSEYISVKTIPNAKYTQSRVRSAIAPQTIASDTAQKTTSNRYPAAPGIEPNQLNGAVPTASSESTEGTNPEPPTRPLPPSPNAMPKPTR